MPLRHGAYSSPNYASLYLTPDLQPLTSLMLCPICKREFEKSASTALPFCCERCRTIDLGRWLGETYALPVPPDPEADELPPEEPDLSNGNGEANGQS